METLGVSGHSSGAGLVLLSLQLTGLRRELGRHGYISRLQRQSLDRAILIRGMRVTVGALRRDLCESHLRLQQPEH